MRYSHINRALCLFLTFVLLFTFTDGVSDAKSIDIDTGEGFIGRNNDNDNLAPATSISVGKKRVLDLNFFNDGSAGSTGSLTGEINSNLRPLLNSNNIDYRINIIDTEPGYISQNYIKAKWREGAEQYYIQLTANVPMETGNTAEKTKSINTLIGANTALVYIGHPVNAQKYNSLISTNQNNGKFFDYSNLNNAITALADYVLNKTTLTLDILVGEGINQDESLINSKVNAIIRSKFAVQDIKADIRINMLKIFKGTALINNLFVVNREFSEDRDAPLPDSWLYTFDPVTNSWFKLIQHESFNRILGTLQMSSDGKLYYTVRNNPSNYIDKAISLMYYDTVDGTVNTCNGFSISSDFSYSLDELSFLVTNNNNIVIKIGIPERNQGSNSAIYYYDVKQEKTTFLFQLKDPASNDQSGPVIVDMGVSFQDNFLFFTYKQSDWLNTYYTNYWFPELGCYDLINKKMVFGPKHFNCNAKSPVIALEEFRFYNNGKNITLNKYDTTNYFSYPDGTTSPSPRPEPSKNSYEITTNGLGNSVYNPPEPDNDYPRVTNKMYIRGTKSKWFIKGVGYDAYTITTPNQYKYNRVKVREDYDNHTKIVQRRKGEFSLRDIPGLWGAKTWVKDKNGNWVGYYYHSPDTSLDFDVNQYQAEHYNAFDGNWYGVFCTQYPDIYAPQNLTVYNITELQDAINFSQGSLDSSNFVVFLGDDNLNELNLEVKKSEALSKLKNSSAYFVGMGTTTNKAQLESVITQNNNKGVFINNSNIDSALNTLAEYIITKVKSGTAYNEMYLAVSENTETIIMENGGINLSTGAQEMNPSVIRSKDFIPVNQGTNRYTLNNNSSTLKNVSVIYYNNMLQRVGSTNTEFDNALNMPANVAYIKIVCSWTDTSTQIILKDNEGTDGETIEYFPQYSDTERDPADYVWNFSHDPLKIAGITITNPTEPIKFSNVDISVPILKFTLPGTYKVEFKAKDKPKQIPDTNNLLPNGNAESVDIHGQLSDWYTWAVDSGITNFTRRTTDDWKIAGNGSFEISTQQGASGTNNACYYKDVVVAPNTGYKLSGLIGTHRCYGYLVIYEMDDNYNILSTKGSNVIYDNAKPQNSELSFTTSDDTTKLRVHILKGDSMNSVPGYADYLFADNITLVKMIPDTRFDEYRKESIPSTVTMYAHRLPRAEFTYQIQNTGGEYSIKNLADNGLSFDPDHTDKANKGIINTQWRWAEVKPDGETIWRDGKLPENNSFVPGTQVLLWYRVQDADGPDGIGAWSKPKVERIDGQLADPVALFIPNPNPLPMQDQLTISDQSYSRNYGGTISSRSWTIQKIGGTIETLVFDSSDGTNGKYYKRFNSLGFGKYIISLTVTDSLDKISKPYSQTVEVIDNINPTVVVAPASGTISSENVTITCKDNTQGNSNNRGLKTIEYVWSLDSVKPQSTDTTTISSEGTFERILTTTQTQKGIWYLYVKDIDHAGNSNNADGSYSRFGPYITNSPPTVSITKLIPGYIYEGDTVKIQYQAGDPDLDTLISDMKLTKNGTVVWSKTKTIAPSGGVYAIQEETVLDQAEAGAYIFSVTVTDQAGETATADTTFTAHELGIIGKVDHTPTWKANWIKYNQYQSSNGKPTYGTDTFFTGENYILSAETTDIAAGSSVTATKVSVKIVEREYLPVLLNKKTTNTFTGEMWNEDMRGTRWRGTYATFIFTVTYSNGIVKTDSVRTYIINDDYWRIKMAF